MHMPGADIAVLRAARRHGMWPLFTLFDTADRAASSRGLQDMIFSDGENEYSGRHFMQLVCSPGRRSIPGFRQEPEHVLRALAHLPELAELGVKIDPRHVDWLWCRRGLRLLDGHGKGMTLGLLVRASDTRTTGYVVLSDLDDAERRVHAIARADLHFLSAVDPTRSQCVGRVFEDYELHSLRTPMFDTRSWLRLGILLSNSPVVGIARRLQAGS
jgi:hypothetical protein